MPLLELCRVHGRPPVNTKQRPLVVAHATLGVRVETSAQRVGYGVRHRLAALAGVSCAAAARRAVPALPGFVGDLVKQDTRAGGRATDTHLLCCGGGGVNGERTDGYLGRRTGQT